MLTRVLKHIAGILLSKKLHSHFSRLSFALCWICYFSGCELLHSPEFRQKRNCHYRPCMSSIYIRSNICSPAFPSSGSDVCSSRTWKRHAERGMERLDWEHGKLE